MASTTNNNTNEADAILAVHQRANQDLIRLNSKRDKTYVREWKRYTEWLRQADGLNQTEPPYLTKQNVSHYFLRVVAKKKGPKIP